MPHPSATTTGPIRRNSRPRRHLRGRGASIAAAAAAVLSACGPGRAPDPEPPAPRVAFDSAVPPVVDLDRFPFPSDAYRTAGRLELAPNPGMDAFTAGPLLAAMAQLDGFGRQAAVQFGIRGELAPPAGPVTRAGGPAGLIVAAPGNPDFGRAVPAEVTYDSRLGLLSLTPALGHPLAPNTAYLAYVSDGFTGPGGRALAADPGFVRIRDGKPESAAEARLAASLDRGLDAAAAAAGIQRRRLVAATLFTTGDPLADMRAAAATIRTAPAPPVRITGAWLPPAWRGAATVATGGGPVSAAAAVTVPVRGLDELFGTPEVPRAGGDNPGGVRHGHIAAVYRFAVRSRQWVDALGHEPFARSGAGQPVTRSMEWLDGVLVVPKCAAPAGGYPVAILQHGLGNDVSFSLILADAFAERCIATVGMDAVGHASRARLVRDRERNVNRSEGADGLADRYDFAGIDQVYLLRPLAARDNLRQTALDLVQLSESLARGDWQAAVAAAADPTLAATGATATTAGYPLAGPPLATERLGYVGQSMGSIVGSMVVALDRNIDRAVINVGGGNYTRIFTESAAFRMAGVGVAALAEADPTAEVRRDHPFLTRIQMVMGGADPIHYGPHWTADPILGNDPKHVLIQIADWDQLIATSASEGLALAAGYPVVGEAYEPGLSFPAGPVGLPAAGTVNGPDGAAYSAGLVRFPRSEHGFLNVRCSSNRFFTEPPYGLRPDPVALANPTDAGQDQAAAFVAAPGGPAPVIVPAAGGVVDPSDCPAP